MQDYLEKRIENPMARGQSTKSSIWIWNSKLSIKICFVDGGRQGVQQGGALLPLWAQRLLGKAVQDGGSSPTPIHFIIVMIRWTGLAPWELFQVALHLPSENRCNNCPGKGCADCASTPTPQAPSPEPRAPIIWQMTIWWTGLALHHGTLNSLFQVALYLPS